MPFATPAGIADDPAGGYTIFEPMQQQPGRRLVTTTKPHSVIVMDHLERKPTAQ